MGSSSINENDLDSPGYEFLRSHRNMVNLYHKLIALDYQRDFCPAYKCPPINQYYFSGAHQNSFEQQFVFTCLCAWLIKDKCQMNFDIDLEDISASVSVIFEALKLLHEDQRGDLDLKIGIRLEQGYGPEVIYALSCFADRALEVALEQDPTFGSGPKIYFHNKLHDQTRTANSITIGQPIVGGTLTTRSLGKYSIEDSSLILDYEGYEEEEERRLGRDSSPGQEGIQSQSSPPSSIDWEQQVSKVAPQLRAAAMNFHVDPRGGDLLTAISEASLNSLRGHEIEHLDWEKLLRDLTISKRAVENFLDQSKSVLQAVETRVNRQVQVVSGREKFLQTNLSQHLERFLGIWRQRCQEQKLNNQLMELINGKTDAFESYIKRLKMLAGDIETRIRELNDGSRLRELEGKISNLEAQSDDLDVKVGLLLAVYGKR